MIKYTIATLASHSCLQILKGAKDEGFATLAISIKDKAFLYRKFEFIDDIIEIDNYRQYFALENKLKKKNCIIIPHGSFVAYLGSCGDEKITLPYFGNKKILEIEGNRVKQHNWLEKSGLNMPRVFSQTDRIDRMVIVKSNGAAGGQGYFIASNNDELRKGLNTDNFKNGKYFIQEHILGVPVYLQYFYSPLHKRLELMGIDRRYETNVDGVGRIPSVIQIENKIEPSYTVIGNFPIVLRESLLPQVYTMGEKVVNYSQKLVPPKGLYGPFCLETIITPNQQFFCIEISCRIVAGTNLYVNGSPYTDLFFGQPMSTGRRIAREIKEAIRLGRLKEVLDYL